MTSAPGERQGHQDRNAPEHVMNLQQQRRTFIERNRVGACAETQRNRDRLDNHRRADRRVKRHLATQFVARFRHISTDELGHFAGQFFLNRFAQLVRTETKGAGAALIRDRTALAHQIDAVRKCIVGLVNRIVEIVDDRG